jgi:hypothetical protein
MPEDRPYTLHVGSDAEGFRVTYVPGSCALELECWGYWSEDIISTFLKHAGAALDKLERPLVVSWDASDFKPQSADGQAGIRSLMKRMAEVPGSRIHALGKNLLTRMQLTRLARDTGLSLEFSDQPVSRPPERSKKR